MRSIDIEQLTDLWPFRLGLLTVLSGLYPFGKGYRYLISLKLYAH